MRKIHFIKIIYRDLFDGKVKFKKFYTNQDSRNFIDHNKIEIIAIQNEELYPWKP